MSDSLSNPAGAQERMKGRITQEHEELMYAQLRGRLHGLVAGMPYRQVALITGIHPETVRRYLRDGRCSGLFLMQVATSLDANGDWLLTGRGYPERELPTRDLPASHLVEHLGRALASVEQRMEFIERQYRTSMAPGASGAEAKPSGSSRAQPLHRADRS